ncbi:MAG TPA: DUF3501 family protein [Stellaceae bacterium]|jgi:hypothetical protein
MTATVTKREITRADIIDPAAYAKDRREFKKRVTDLKRDRRVEVGPFATFYFENYDTMWHQIHEMLHIERGGEPQIVDELEAYNPLIPKGSELIATVMIEIEDAVRRARILATLGGIEHKMFISVAGERIVGIPDPTRENTSEDGKASSVQFVRFPFTAAQIAKFRAAATQILVGIDHPNYGHIAVMPERVRTALAGDFA